MSPFVQVAELAAVNRELQLRVKVLEDDRSRLLEKVGGTFSRKEKGKKRK